MKMVPLRRNAFQKIFTGSYIVPAGRLAGGDNIINKEWRGFKSGLKRFGNYYASLQKRTCTNVLRDAEKWKEQVK